MGSLDLVWFSFLRRSHPSDKASGALGSYVQAQGCTAGEQPSQEPVHSLLEGSTCEHAGSVVGKASADWQAGRASTVLSKPVSPSLPGCCDPGPQAQEAPEGTRQMPFVALGKRVAAARDGLCPLASRSTTSWSHEQALPGLTILLKNKEN